MKIDAGNIVAVPTHIYFALTAFFFHLIELGIMN